MVHKRLIFLLLTSMMHLHATYKQYPERNVLVELKGAYVLPASHTFREIYHNGGEFAGEITVQLHQERPVFVFASVGVIPLHGKSVGFCTKTKATIVPLAAGLKYFVDCNTGDFYIGLGVLGAHLSTKDNSSFVISSRKNWGVGGIAKLGFLVDASNGWFIDLFSEYAFVKVGFPNKFVCGVESHTAKIPHWSAGLGLGYRFA